MALLRLTFVLLLHSIFLVNIYGENNFGENSDEYYRPQIWCFVNYLNNDPNRIYNYNYGTLINAQNKELDNTDLTIDVEVECRDSKINCDVNILECSGTVKYNTETANYEVIPGASCNTKTQIETTSYIPIEETQTDVSEEKIIPSEFTSNVESSSEYSNAEPVQEQFFKKTVPLLGGPMDLNHNIEGLNILTDTALKHIESEREYKPVLLRIIRVQRQIVSGVKYILTLEVASTNCPKHLDANYPCTILSSSEPEICEITYYQQPWINRNKNIISNNCTQTQEFSAFDSDNSAANDQDNEIDTNYNPKKPFGYRPHPVQPEPMPIYPNYDVIADTGNADDILKMSGNAPIDTARLRDIESQIIHMMSESPKTTTYKESSYNIDDQIVPKVNTEPLNTELNTNSASNEDIPTTVDSVLTEEQKSSVDDFMEMMDDQPRVKRGTKNDNDDDSSSSSSSSSEENNNNNNDNDDDKEYEKTKRKSKKVRKHDDNDDDNDDDDDDDDDNNNHNNKNNKDDDSSSSSSSSSSEEDDNKGKGKKHKSKKNKREVKENSSSESNESEQKDATTITPSNSENLIKKDKDNSDDSSSEEHRGGVRRRRNVNNLVKISPEEKNFVHNLAEFSATTLDDIDADDHKRVILQVLGAKRNIEGNLYYLTLRVGVSKCLEENHRLIDLNKEYKKDKCGNKLFENLTKICKVQIKVDNNRMNPKVEKSQCQNMKKEQENSNMNRTNRSKRGGERLVGGVTPVNPDDDEIQQYAKNIILEMNAKDGVGATRKYVKIHQASKQIVAGILYKLKVEIDESGKSSICDIEVWDRAWMTPPKEVKMTCQGQNKKEYRFKRSLLGRDDHDIHIGLFKDFMQKHNKKYSSKTEFKHRFHIFRKNMKTIKYLNENEQGTAKYGPTMFADLAEEEYKEYLGLRTDLKNNNDIPMPQAVIPDVELPVEFDWRKKGVISEVKNQGQCGSCWAFSVTGNIEGLNAIKTGNLIELSEQELVDCDNLDNGCNGGLPDNAYRAIEKLGGLETETDYPYEAENEKCHFNKTLSKVQISGAVNISSNETDMAKWLIHNGPISIGINANAMQFYMGGVSHPWKFLCSPDNLDHGVLIVGYGMHKYPLFKKALPYWIVKNSWGPTWGEQGYYRVYRGDGTCGVNMMASSAVL